VRPPDEEPRGASGEDERGGLLPPLGPASRTLFGDPAACSADQLDAIAQLRSAGPAVGELLGSHSFLSGQDASRTVEELFGGEALEWDSLRTPYVGMGLVVAMSLLLADPPLGGRGPELALRVGFGLDRENGLLRDRLYGRFGRQLDLWLRWPTLPRHEIDFDELFRRTCMVGVLHALYGFGRATGFVPREWASGVITDIKPPRGCDGDWVEILGHGFGGRQPSDVTLNFTAYAGGLVVASVLPGNWSDTRILVEAPAGVGNGPVGFIRASGSSAGETVASAAEQLAGEAEGCLGMGAARFAQKLRELGPALDAPHVSSTGSNRFVGGRPKILGFVGNGAMRVLLRPRGPLVLTWVTNNADSVEIKASGSPELPTLPAGLPTSGEQRFATVAATSSWTGTYTLIATNPCGQVQQTIDVEMRERRALVLAGGGSKGAFEVGAVRCLTDVFGFTPDLLCGASVGALNAAKLCEGPGALADLESMWLGMQNSSDLFLPTGWVTRLVNNLAQLGVKYVGGIDIADLLGVRLGSGSWLSPEAELTVGVAKNAIGLVSGAGALFTVNDLIFGAARAGLLLGKVKQNVEGLLASPSLFLSDPVRSKIDAQIDPAKIAKSGLELRIAMVNLDDGKVRYVDQRGRFVDDNFPVNLRDGLQASASIPIAFPPMTLPGGNYVDGGVRDNAPITVADLAGASSIVAVLPSPEHMTFHSYTSAAFPAIAARSFEAVFDETWQNDLAPFRGYNVPVKVIAPQIETHSLFKVDPGLVRIDIDYGYMRAFDEMQGDDAVRPRLRHLSLEIATKRLEVWGPLEHGSEGKMRDEERALFLAVGQQPVPEAFSLAELRQVKIEIREHCLERQTLVKNAKANPAGIERAWQEWERHKWLATILTPWEATHAHVGPALAKVVPPGPLPPP